MSRPKKWVLGTAMFGMVCAVVLGACAHRTSFLEPERKFLTALTYPTEDWAADDFGANPSVEDRALLEKFKPHIVIAPGSLPPVDFYDEYLPHTIVRKQWRRKHREAPDRAYLKSIERDRRYYLDYQGEPPCRGAECAGFTGTLYGRVFRETMKTPEGVEPVRSEEVVVLKYTGVFENSGLPAGVSGLKKFGARLAGDLDSWHELDIHGAIQLLFFEGADIPFAVMLAQHNHFRSFLVGKDLEWPEDGRLPVCYSKRSNEPYLCGDSAEPVRHRAVGDPTQIRYLVMGGKAPITGDDDVVYAEAAGGTRVPCKLEVLPERDPLYVSWISLGDLQRICGFIPSFARKGPPGININTFPEVSEYSQLVQLWYLQDGDEESTRIIETNAKSFFRVDFPPILKHQGQRFWDDLETQRGQSQAAPRTPPESP